MNRPLNQVPFNRKNLFSCRQNVDSFFPSLFMSLQFCLVLLILGKLNVCTHLHADWFSEVISSFLLQQLEWNIIILFAACKSNPTNCGLKCLVIRERCPIFEVPSYSFQTNFVILHNFGLFSDLNGFRPMNYVH